MSTKSILFGCAVALAFGGAGYAQQADNKSTANQSQTQMHQSTSTKTVHATKTVHHYRHHVRHVVHTAVLHSASTPAERQATRNLNMQEAGYGVGAAYGERPMSPYSAAYQQRPGEYGPNPVNRIPITNAYETASPPGVGSSNGAQVAQPHAR